MYLHRVLVNCVSILLFLCYLPITLTTEKKDPWNYAQKYLTKYGYVSAFAYQEFNSTLKYFQQFAGLEPTGELNQETLQMMELPRCGVHDIVVEDVDMPRILSSNRQKRYALQGSRWKVKDITYKISKYPNGLSKEEVDKAIKEAFKVWERATDLKFTKKDSGNVHIEIRFERKSHGDDDPFDGEGGTLAHAFFPVFGGDAHFDADEDWSVNSPRGTSLVMTAAHELGHSLGLSHSNDRNSLMAPFYRGYDPNLSLGEDDISGIQALYGGKTSSVDVRSNSVTTSPPRTSRPTETTTPKREIDNKGLCFTGKLDTIVTMKTKVTYAFVGDQYWKLTDTSVALGFPRSISVDWGGLPGNLDASFTWTNGKTYFFKGSKYWRFSEVGVMDDGYPNDLSGGFSGIPNNIDAAFVWPGNNKIYFFKGAKYWKFNPDTKPPVDAKYPRPISNWEGIPNNLDSALQYSNGMSYFFKNGRYYRFDDDRFSVDNTANPPFPRDTGFWWFGCSSKSGGLTRAEDVSWADEEVMNDNLVQLYRSLQRFGLIQD